MIIAAVIRGIMTVIEAVSFSISAVNPIINARMIVIIISQVISFFVKSIIYSISLGLYKLIVDFFINTEQKLNSLIYDADSSL
jgi:hypothetical protein